MKRDQFDFIKKLNYPSKNLRKLGKEPISVPQDPLIKNFIPFKGKKIRPNNFFYSLYFTAFDVRDYGDNIEKFLKIFRPLNIKKIYLEIFRDGYMVDKEFISKIKNLLEKKGYFVAGAITPTHLSDTQNNEIVSPASCYTDTVAKKNLKNIFISLAKIFNEVIIDDWFFTVCRCKNCKKQKKSLAWSEFRLKLMTDIAKKYIIDPSKRINKNINLILKLPQWYEDYHYTGYNLKTMISLFDEIAVGVETRDYKFTEFLPVHGSLLFNYIKNLKPSTKKAWFDVYLCNKEIYTEQAYQSIIAGAEEIILFCAGGLPLKKYRPLVEYLISLSERFSKYKKFSNIFNIPVIRKYNSEGEKGLHQSFLMSGIPLYLTDKINVKEKLVILTLQSEIKNYDKLFEKFLNNKKDIILTVEVAQKIRKYFKIKKLKNKIKINNVKYKERFYKIKNNLFIEFDVKTSKKIGIFNSEIGFLNYFKIKNSNVWVLNLPESDEKINGITGEIKNVPYRYLIKEKIFKEIFKDLFSQYSNFNLYDKIKTYHEYVF